jgi:hypothetical protein
MRRHLITGRYGPADKEEIPTAPDEVVTQLDLVASQRKLGHGIGQALDDLAALGLVPSEMGLDVLVMASMVYAADTRISRQSESQDAWTREIRLVVPVQDVNAWNTVRGDIERILGFLTGDIWTVGFRARPDDFANAVPPAAVPAGATKFSVVALFSGGLDSLIGAIDALESGGTPLLVSHAADPATSTAQDGTFDALKERYQGSCERLRAWINFPAGLVQDVESESTTRGRSFLFFALGICAGTALGRPFELHVPENGLISLNIPLDVLRLGANSTRTTHPFYIARWNEVIKALGIAGVIRNPYWGKTKGQMARECRNQGLLKAVVGRSLSCSAPAKGRWQGLGIQHCGYCLPCLIRRAALRAAWGAGADPTVYTVADLTAGALDTNQAEGKQVRSFQVAIARLRARPGVERILIHKTGSLSCARSSRPKRCIVTASGR